MNNFIKVEKGIRYFGDDISWEITHEALQNHFGLKDLNGLQCAKDYEGIITAKARELKLNTNDQSDSIVEITYKDFN